MPRISPFTIVLTADERQHLEKMARKYTASYASVIRAKVILLAAQGLGNHEIAARVDLPRQVISKWRKRFFEHRLDGLHDQPRRPFSPR